MDTDQLLEIERMALDPIAREHGLRKFISSFVGWHVSSLRRKDAGFNAAVVIGSLVVTCEYEGKPFTCSFAGFGSRRFTSFNTFQVSNPCN